MCHNHATSQRKLLFINGNIHATFLLREGGEGGGGGFWCKKNIFQTWAQSGGLLLFLTRYHSQKNPSNNTEKKERPQRRVIFYLLLFILVKITKPLVCKNHATLPRRMMCLFVLQVIRLKYKSISPERPLVNLFNSYRSVFTPMQKVSLHTYGVTWDGDAIPTCVYISFVK